MPKNRIFLDLGYYAGIAEQKYKVDDSWTVYAWEPNLEVPVPDWVSRKAVWTKKGKQMLNTNERGDAAYLATTRGLDGSVEVETIDFSGFVKGLPADSYIVCSMDVEGAEFDILTKMLEEHTIDKIDVLDIEFHHRLMTDYTPTDAQKLIDQIKKRGVKVKLKVELN